MRTFSRLMEQAYNSSQARLRDGMNRGTNQMYKDVSHWYGEDSVPVPRTVFFCPMLAGRGNVMIFDHINMSGVSIGFMEWTTSLDKARQLQASIIKVSLAEYRELQRRYDEQIPVRKCM